MKKIQCFKCGQTFWKELQVGETQVASGEWIENPCPVCGAEWAIVEPRMRGRRAARRRAKPGPRRRVRRKRAAMPAKGRPSGFTPARIRSLRKKLGLSQKQLSSLMGVNRATVALWETGKFRPKEAKMAQLAGFAKMGKNDVKSLLAEKTPPRAQEKRAKKAQGGKPKRKARARRKQVSLPKEQKS